MWFDEAKEQGCEERYCSGSGRNILTRVWMQVVMRVMQNMAFGIAQRVIVVMPTNSGML